MSDETEWFEGTQPAYKRPIILPLFIWLAIIACVLFIAGGLSGCASSPSPRSEPRAEVCYLRLLGHTEDGMSVVMQQCVPSEAFAEAQK